MTDGEQRPSLFSIHVDDVVIQRIFESLEGEVATLIEKVRSLQDDIQTRSTKEELDNLASSVTTLSQNSDNFVERIDKELVQFTDKFTKEVNEAKAFVRDQISEATFSINNVIRAQNALIEEKVFEMTKPTFEFTTMKADVARLKEENAELKAQISDITTFFSSFMGKKGDGDEGRVKKTLHQIIDEALAGDRESIAVLVQRQELNEETMKKMDAKFHRTFGDFDDQFPLWGKGEKKSFADKPKLPVMGNPKTFLDYFSWLMEFGPNCQKIFNAFYHQIVSLSNSVYDKVERERNMDQLENSLQLINNMRGELDALREDHVGKGQLELLSSEVDTLRDEIVSKDDLEVLKRRIDEIQSNDVQKETIEEYVNGIQRKVTSMVNEALEDLRNREFPMEMKRQEERVDDMMAGTVGYVQERPTLRDGDGLPAIAAVTPRGKAAFNMIYGETPTSQYSGSGKPASSRVVVKRKEQIEELGKQPRKAVKPPSRIQFPGELQRPQTAHANFRPFV